MSDGYRVFVDRLKKHSGNSMLTSMGDDVSATSLTIGS